MENYDRYFTLCSTVQLHMDSLEHKCLSYCLYTVYCLSNEALWYKQTDGKCSFNVSLQKVHPHFPLKFCKSSLSFLIKFPKFYIIFTIVLPACVLHKNFEWWMVVSHRLLPTTFSERPSTARFPLQNYFYSLWHMLIQCKYLPQSAGSPCECISEPASSVSVSRFNSLSTSSASASTSSAKPSFNSRACMETSFVTPQNYTTISNTVCSTVYHVCVIQLETHHQMTQLHQQQSCVHSEI